MKYSTILLWCLFVLACSKNGAAIAEDYLTKEAKLVNQLAVDGCGWHFGVDLDGEYGQFAADEATQRDVVEPFIQRLSSQNGVYSVKVEITFKLTNNKRDVLCGWNKTNSMEVIELKAIREL
ncbi:MAG: hypothetical protein SH818_11015 [Saprospiraceae bacterium]|nr:hypothetical protein [Saprospiraceae bacterium]